MEMKGKYLMRYLLCRACLVLMLACLGMAQVNAADKETYILAVVPQFTPSEVHRNWTPFIQQLSRATGQNFQIRIYPSIPKFEADFLNGKIDLAFMNPYHAVMARKAQGYIPLVRDDANRLSGILVVRRNSPIKSVKELNGKEIVFPAPNAFGASLYMRALLAGQKGIHLTPRYVKTHTNVYRHVILGEAAAGGGVNTTLKHEPPEVQAQLRILFETPEVAPHPLCAHPRVPAAVRQAVVDAMLEMGRNPAMQRQLAEMQISRAVKADYARDYQPLEKLKLEKYVVIEKE